MLGKIMVTQTVSLKVTAKIVVLGLPISAHN